METRRLKLKQNLQCKVGRIFNFQREHISELLFISFIRVQSFKHLAAKALEVCQLFFFMPQLKTTKKHQREYAVDIASYVTPIYYLNCI